MKKFLAIIVLGLLLGACAGEVPPGGNDPMGTGGLAHGQWTTPVQAGSNRFMSEGWDTNTVMQGTAQWCSNRGKSRNVIDLTPHTRDSRATLIFNCK